MKEIEIVKEALNQNLFTFIDYYCPCPKWGAEAAKEQDLYQFITGEDWYGKSKETREYYLETYGRLGSQKAKKAAFEDYKEVFKDYFLAAAEAFAEEYANEYLERYKTSNNIKD